MSKKSKRLRLQREKERIANLASSSISENYNTPYADCSWDIPQGVVFRFPLQKAIDLKAIRSYCAISPIENRTFEIRNTSIVVIVDYDKLIFLNTEKAKVLLVHSHSFTGFKKKISCIDAGLFVESTYQKKGYCENAELVHRVIKSEYDEEDANSVLLGAIYNRYSDVVVQVESTQNFNTNCVVYEDPSSCQEELDDQEEHKLVLTELYTIYALMSDSRVVELDTTACVQPGKIFTWVNVEAMAMEDIFYLDVIGYFLEVRVNPGTPNYQIPPYSRPDEVIFFKDR